MKEITKIEPTTVIEGEVKEITVFYSTGDPVVFEPKVVEKVAEPEVITPEVPVETPEAETPTE